MNKAAMHKLLRRHHKAMLLLALAVAVVLELVGLGVVGEVLKRGIDLAGFADVVADKVEEL